MPDLTNLADFLLARISDDEALARQVPCRCPGEFSYRVLAECEAKRQMVDLYRYAYDDHTYLRCLRLLALPYAAHADYRDEWRPLADAL